MRFAFWACVCVLFFFTANEFSIAFCLVLFVIYFTQRRTPSSNRVRCKEKILIWMCKWSGTTTHSNFTSNSILSTKFCRRRLLLYLCHGEHICRYRIRFHIMPFTCEYRTTWFCIHQTHKEKSRKKSGSKMWRYKPTVFCLLNVVKYLFLWLFFVVCQFATSWKWENILEKVVRIHSVRYFLRSAPVFIS